jgi:hypothetical protein
MNTLRANKKMEDLMAEGGGEFPQAGTPKAARIAKKPDGAPPYDTSGAGRSMGPGS